MAKDILINTQSGDWIASDNTIQTMFWNVVWGKLFDSDEAEYMNIVVPNGYINKVHYKNREFQCYAIANYYPVNSTFLVRLVVYNVATNEYEPIQKYSIDAPEPMGAVYFPVYTEKSQDVEACQLPLINADGKFVVLFKKYENSNFSRAIISSAENADFNIGDSDSQSAQLLAKCAPGKYYRYPTTGLDLTKYINSVVEHTNLTDSLVKEYASDLKQVIEAEFDNSNGDLKILFSGTNEATDTNLMPTEKLDVELFRLADDDFVRAAYKQAQTIVDDNGDFIDEISSIANFYGLVDVGASASLDTISPQITQGKNDWGWSGTWYCAEMVLEAGRIYALNYPSNIIQYNDNNGFQHGSLFAIYKEKEAIYVDEPFFSSGLFDAILYRNSFNCRRCFIPLEELTIRFYAGGTPNYLEKNGYGIRPVSDIQGNYDSILGLSVNNITGKMTGIVSSHSSIEDAKLDIGTNQILIIKQINKKMAASDVLTIGSVVKHRGEYNNDTTYYVSNQVTMCGCVFQAIANNFKGVAPIKIAEDGSISLSNSVAWKCIIDNVAMYNYALGVGTISNDEIDKLF